MPFPSWRHFKDGSLSDDALFLPAVVDKQFSQGGMHRALLLRFILCVNTNKNMGFLHWLRLLMNEWTCRMCGHATCVYGVNACKQGWTGSGRVCTGRCFFYCSVYTQRDKMSPTEKTRKVNWNGGTWHLFNPAVSGLLQIKSIFNKSSGQLGFGEVDAKLSGCLSGNIYLISTQLKEKAFGLLVQARNIMLGDDLRPYFGESSLPNPPTPPPHAPPHCLFSASTCVTFPVPHILVIREDWLMASYKDGCGY